MKPLEIWKSQGTGVGLPLIIPLSENPRGDKALMDQLVDTGSRTIKGIAAVNGLALRRMRVGKDVSDQVRGFEEAAAEMEPVMKAVRELDIHPHFEMESGKLQDTFSIFKRRVGSKEGEESETTLEEEESEEEEPKENDDEVDFGVTDDDAEFEEEKDEEEVQPDEPPEPVWPDIMNGPLRGDGPFEVEPYTGDPRFPYAAVWPVRKPKREIMPEGLGIRMVYQHKHGHFTTVTRVVAATPGGSQRLSFPMQSRLCRRYRTPTQSLGRLRLSVLHVEEGVLFVPKWKRPSWFHAVHARTGFTWSAAMGFRKEGMCCTLSDH